MGTFEDRLRNFAEEGELSAFNLACVADGLDKIKELSDQNVGGETVEVRLGEYKSWDPEVFKVDKDCEDLYRRRLEESGRAAVLLSEEAGRVEINAHAEGETVYCVCDPFDGSYLFKRGIPDFWYSSLAFFSKDFEPLSCAVGDGWNRHVAFANEKGAFTARLEGDRLVHKFKLDAKYRETMGRKHAKDTDGASVESYAMKPKKFLLPLVDKYRSFMEPFKFFLPNGGPYAFADVAEGKIDVYFAPKQPFVDIFSGLQIALKAGCPVTDFDGNEAKCSDDVKQVLDVVCSTNEELHEKVLKRIAECK